MNMLVHYTTCPVCASPDFENVLTVKDHSVSQKSFSVAECPNCRLRFTQDAPGPDAIGAYYKAEDYISHTNTSKGLVNRIYKFVRNRTMVRKRKLVQRATGKKVGKLLDVGSGIGTFVHEMKVHGWQVQGLEPDDDARKVANQLYGETLLPMNVFQQLPTATFDAITMWHVMEHVHDLSNYVDQLGAILKKEGRLFVAVPNYTSLDAKIYGACWAAYDVPRHLYHFSPESMKVLMEQHGFKIEEYRPMWYDSFYISLLSSKYKSGSTKWLGAAWTGFRSNLAALRDARKCSSVIYIIRKVR
jgi:2-polyprenyl-3-methyl-5-hydroxy-6-metoxy-1,4-benzoquinol methylase